MMQAGAALNDLDVAQLLGDYRVLPGISDELVDNGGNIRPVWQPLLRHLAAQSPHDLDQAISRADQYLRDRGVYFRQYGKEGSTPRDWPLSHIPLMIEMSDWEKIASGLSERGDLLETMMADFYGENRLVADGLLPAQVLAANPEWLRPAVGIRPRGGHFLHHIAFDIGRGPDGNWWVLGDRIQAPSGAGFALETRMATSRAFSSLMNEANVVRLAGFFRAFRDALDSMRQTETGRVGILTPGPMNDTYFEHAYIARYLGFTLMQGADLTVENGRLMVRTVAGLMPVEVLWRRLDSAWVDPLELEEGSHIGTPGMVGALRAGSCTLINALGSGVLEARSMMAFTPRIAEHLTGRPLSLPNIATWWCGDQAALDYAIANVGRMTIDAAMSTRLPFDHGPDVVIAGKTVDGTPVNPDWIRQNAGGLVAQEILSLSTAPALDGHRLVARPMSLRVFLARTRQGWQVMPGGFARIGRSGASVDTSMQRGGSVCDVWVMSDRPVGEDTLLTEKPTGYRRAALGALPSSAADNLMWLGRYVERAEGQIRLLRAYHLRIAEAGSANFPLAGLITEHLAVVGVDPAEPLPPGLMADVDAALRCAGNVQDRFSVDGWNALVDLRKTMAEFALRVGQGDDAARAYSVLLRKISGFAGLVHENMYRSMGWRFLGLGRAIERAQSMLRILQDCTGPTAPSGALDLAIEVGDSVMTHRRRYSVDTDPNTVLDLLLLDDMNPRSVLHQFHVMEEHAAFLPKPGDEKLTPFQIRVMEIVTILSTSTAKDITPDQLTHLLGRTNDMPALLARSYMH